jgi:hypothetical protein
MTGEILLQVAQPNGGRCLLIEGLALAETVRITIEAAAAAAPATAADALALFEALRDELRRLGGQERSPQCGGRYQGTGACLADRDAPRDHNVLVVMEDRQADIEPAKVAAFAAFGSYELVPVAMGNVRATPSAALRYNLLQTYPAGAIARVVPDVLERARVTPEGFRIFISYVHDEAGQAAAGLFHRLAEARFAVFLDRFVGAPGQNFVDLIMAELFDKGCLLVLETPSVQASPWVSQEVATAQAFRLGLMAVRLPGSTAPFGIFPALDLLAANYGSPLGRHGALGDAEEIKVVDFVRRHMAQQAARRRRWQRRTLDAAVTMAKAVAGGRTAMGLRASAGGRDYELTTSARPPDVGCFRRLHAGRVAGCRQVVFGPLVHQLPGDAASSHWLSTVSGIGAHDEGAMLATLCDAVAGRAI